MPDDSSIASIGKTPGTAGSAELTRVMTSMGDWYLATAVSMLGNRADAEDALQDAFVSALRALDRFRGTSRTSTWMYRIVVNRCLMELRRRRRAAGSMRVLLQARLQDRPRNGRSPEPCDDLRDCFDALPPSHRTILVLRDVLELDTASSARSLGISGSAAKVRLHRARRSLRCRLERREP